MGHTWVVTHKPPAGAKIHEPDEVRCTGCGILALRWAGQLYISIYKAVRLLVERSLPEPLPIVNPECTGTYIEWTTEDPR